KTNLQRFLFDFNQLGKTPYLPQLRKIGKEQIEISGISFFRYGHVVDTIPAEKMFYFKLLVDKYSQGTLKSDHGQGNGSSGKYPFKIQNAAYSQRSFYSKCAAKGERGVKRILR
ncbi:Ger(x)C family spore germination protein, partial [Bacillus sp. ISL-40]|nr:Ger(x)C family spore germination protein [Bacillus sp. ISL-40]